MKNLLFIMLLLFSLNINAQIKFVPQPSNLGTLVQEQEPVIDTVLMIIGTKIVEGVKVTKSFKVVFSDDVDLVYLKDTYFKVPPMFYIDDKEVKPVAYRLKHSIYTSYSGFTTVPGFLELTPSLRVEETNGFQYLNLNN